MENATAIIRARNFTLYSSQCSNLAVIWIKVLGYSSRGTWKRARWAHTLVLQSFPLLNCQFTPQLCFELFERAVSKTKSFVAPGAIHTSGIAPWKAYGWDHTKDRSLYPILPHDVSATGFAPPNYPAWVSGIQHSLAIRYHKKHSSMGCNAILNYFWQLELKKTHPHLHSYFLGSLKHPLGPTENTGLNLTKCGTASQLKRKLALNCVDDSQSEPFGHRTGNHSLTLFHLG